MEEELDRDQMHLIGMNALTGLFYIVRVKGQMLISVAVGHKDAYLVN